MMYIAVQLDASSMDSRDATDKAENNNNIIIINNNMNCCNKKKINSKEEIN